MPFLNTHWTWSYFLMLLFVFWTLWMLSRSWFPVAIRAYYTNKREERTHYVLGTVLRCTWAALGTYFFHCIW